MIGFGTLKIGLKFKKDGKTWRKNSKMTAEQITDDKSYRGLNFHFRKYEKVEIYDESRPK